MFTLPKTTIDWMRGLIAVAVNGAASAVILLLAAPETFNWQAGRSKLLSTAGTFVALGVANYLKTSPLPPESSTTTVTATVTTVQTPPVTKEPDKP